MSTAVVHAVRYSFSWVCLGSGSVVLWLRLDRSAAGAFAWLRVRFVLLSCILVSSTVRVALARFA
jgi:hypothetical protein